MRVPSRSCLAERMTGLQRLIKHVAPGGLAYRRALLSDVVSAAALGGVGDVICQVAVEGVSWEDVEKRRVIALTVFSSAYIGTLPSCCAPPTGCLADTGSGLLLGRCILSSFVQNLSCMCLCAGGRQENCMQNAQLAVPYTTRASDERRECSERSWLRCSGQPALWRDIYSCLLHRRWTVAGRFGRVGHCQLAKRVVDHIHRLHRLLATLHVVQLSVRSECPTRSGDGIGQPSVVSGH